MTARDTRYGYRDDNQSDKPFRWKIFPLLAAIIFLSGSWLFLYYNVIFGENWISETYDHVGWRTNEGATQTYGAWDLEAHIWKSMFIMEHWPHVQWNPYWYLGMPLLKYYQAGFYAVHIAVIQLFDLHPAYAANIIVMAGHLLAVLTTFLLCLRISRRYTLSAMLAFFLLSNTFMSLRSFGWEPITVVFLWLFPATLLLFFRQPLRPFRLSMVFALTISYLAHPLIWFALCMTIGLYLLIISIGAGRLHGESIAEHNTLTKYVVLVFSSLLLGGVQSVPHFTYHQVTSGAHMGISYLPYYHVLHNIISPIDFFFNFGNLRGPGPIVLVAALLLLVFSVIYIIKKRKKRPVRYTHSRVSFVRRHALVVGLAWVACVMIVFYYLAYFNIFPMNIFNSVQYHRMMPEFIIISAALISSLIVLARTRAAKILFYGTVFAFMFSSAFVLYGIQSDWNTVSTLDNKFEMIQEDIPGRFSMPYTEQSLAVRNSFTNQHQVYGYYEQGITNAYADELFSVSSGFHGYEPTLLYLQAAGVTRLYVNQADTIRNEAVRDQLDGELLYFEVNERYAYFNIPISDPSFAQAVSWRDAAQVLSVAPGCREMFQEVYCGSEKQEFVTRDVEEQRYLRAYVNMLESPYDADAEFVMINPDTYRIHVTNATQDTAVVIKMTQDRSWRATVQGKRLPITTIGPDFMVVYPQRSGEYTIDLSYRLSIEHMVGVVLSVLTLIGLLGYFGFAQTKKVRRAREEHGDLVHQEDTV